MFKEAPYKWYLFDLFNHIKNGPQVNLNGTYWPARPYGFYGLYWRVTLAWAVFTGKADAVFWPGQKNEAY